MRRNLKKMLAAALVGSMAAAVLSGCGGGSNSSTGTGSSAGSESGGAAGSEAEYDPMADLGKDFTWIMEANDIADYNNIEFEDGPVMSYWLSKDWEVPGRNETTKITIDISTPAQGSDIYEATNNLFATGEYADVMNMACVGLTPLELYEMDIAIDLTDYIDRYMPNYK